MKYLHELSRLREIPAPAGLKERTLQAIEQGKEVMDMKQLRRKTRRRIAAVITAACACFVVAVNASPALALGLADIPALGALVRVICVRADLYRTDDSTVSVEVPQIDGSAAERVNTLIEQQVKAYEDQAAADIAAYKEAFLATGGTEAEFDAKNIQVKVDYEVKSETADYVSFVLSGSQDWNASTVQRYYYNLRLSDGSAITLQDLLGDDWAAKANGQIVTQIEAYNRTHDLRYFTPETENGFRTVDADTHFYINAQGNPVVVFDKYEIGPGALGEPEFTLDIAK